MSSGIPPAIVSTATLTIACGSILRYLSRSGSSTQDLSGSPSWSGTAAPPVPTITLAIRSGCAAAANSAADVPTSGATMCGRPRSASTMSWARNPPIARGDMRSSRRSEAPKPGRSIANRRACSAKRGPHRRERVHALRPRTREQQRRLARATAVGVPDPQSVDGTEAGLRDRCRWHLRDPPGSVVGHDGDIPPRWSPPCRPQSARGRRAAGSALGTDVSIQPATEVSREPRDSAGERPDTEFASAVDNSRRDWIPSLANT